MRFVTRGMAVAPGLLVCGVLWRRLHGFKYLLFCGAERGGDLAVLDPGAVSVDIRPAGPLAVQRAGGVAAIAA